MIKYIIILICFSLISLGQVKDSAAILFSKYILSSELSTNLNVLASDEYEGRETGMKGQKMAADYIAAWFKNVGIPSINGSYFQQFGLSIYKPQKISFKIGANSFKQDEDFYSTPAVFLDSILKINKVVFAGYGINSEKYNNYKDINVNGKTVLILGGELLDKQKKSVITGISIKSEWATNNQLKYNEARAQGVKILLVADGNLKKSMLENTQRINSTRMRLAEDSQELTEKGPLVINISEAMCNKILADSKNNINALKLALQKKTVSNFEFESDISLNLGHGRERLNAENVLGFVEGTDLKKEIVVISAHYDHLGMHNGVVYNGADDDGSGTVAVMQLAKAFAEAKRQGKGSRRSILFMCVAGEEKGLLGSDYYTRHPIFSLANTIVDLNIDMIGRLDAKHKNDANYVYIIGSNMLSNTLHNINEAANKTYVGLDLDYTFNSTSDPNQFYYRSDHYNFAKNNIPVIFYFNGVHADYHKETDDVQKINFEKIEKISKLVFFTAWKIANRNERIKLNDN